MSKVKTTMLRFPGSDSPDVTGYVLYVEEDPAEVSYDSPSWDLGLETEIDLASLEGFPTKDTIYNFGVTAMDDAGNESSMSLLNSVALDFAAPNPPGPLTIERL